MAGPSYPPGTPDEQKVTTSEILFGDLVDAANPTPEPIVIYTFGGTHFFYDPNDPFAP